MRTPKSSCLRLNDHAVLKSALANAQPLPSLPDTFPQLSFLAFLLTAFVLSITPGPGIAYVVACTVAGGRREGLASCLGTAVGGLIHVAAAAVGISLLITESALLFNSVKYIGAAYLVYLGIKLLLRKVEDRPAQAIGARGATRSFLEGIVVEAMNVKTALFFLAFLPQFASPDQPIAQQLALLGSICVVLNTTVDVFAVFAADRLLKADKARATRARVLTRISGCTMLGLGTFLAFAKR